MLRVNGIMATIPWLLFADATLPHMTTSSQFTPLLHCWTCTVVSLWQPETSHLVFLFHFIHSKLTPNVTHCYTTREEHTWYPGADVQKVWFRVTVKPFVNQELCNHCSQKGDDQRQTKPRPRPIKKPPQTDGHCRKRQRKLEIVGKINLAEAWLIPTKTARHRITLDHSTLQHGNFPRRLSIQGYSRPTMTAAAPHTGGTHQSDFIRLPMTSTGNSVTLRWICSKCRISARHTPMKNRTPARRIIPFDVFAYMAGR